MIPLLLSLLPRHANGPHARLNTEAVYRVVMLVPETGFEPVRGCPHRFLRPKRLPFRHSGVTLLYLNIWIDHLTTRGSHGSDCGAFRFV